MKTRFSWYALVLAAAWIFTGCNEGELSGISQPGNDASLGAQEREIINGYLADANAKKVAGALFVSSDNAGWSFICGCVYLGSNASGESWAITAAHCVEAAKPYPYVMVGFGGADLRTFADQARAGQAARVTQLVTHESYDAASISNDIGVMKLDRIPPNALRATLATTTTDPADNATTYIAGYGVYKGSSISTALRYADTIKISMAQCGKTWAGLSAATQVCVLDNGTQGACNGDSGGPAYKSDLTVFGLTSFGITRCSTRYPQVYTRVSGFRTWIQSKTGL